MSLTGGKRKVNKSLKAWVAFVKKVQKEEKISYKEAIHRAKQRKDKGEKWLKGGATETLEEIDMEEMPDGDGGIDLEEDITREGAGDDDMTGGRHRRRRTMRRRSRSRGRGRGRTARRSRSRSSRRH